MLFYRPFTDQGTPAQAISTSTATTSGTSVISARIGVPQRISLIPCLVVIAFTSLRLSLCIAQPAHKGIEFFLFGLLLLSGAFFGFLFLPFDTGSLLLCLVGRFFSFAPDFFLLLYPYGLFRFLGE